MPKLVDLKTNLKDLRFGMDQIGGGNSGQPYKTFPIPDDNASPLATDFWVNNNTSLDYPLRGGGLVSTTRTTNYTLSSQIDKDRIKSFLQDAPRGPLFLQKQADLVAANPLMETGTPSAALNALQSLAGVLGAGIPQYVSTGANNQYYNGGLSLVAQILASGTGLHIPYNGSNKALDVNAQYYTDIVGQQIYHHQEDQTYINRLLMLQDSKLHSGFQGNSTVDLSDNALSLGISSRNLILFDYPGGPGSTYGIGNTVIKRAVNSSDAYNLTQYPSTQTLFPNVLTMTYEQIRSAEAHSAYSLAVNNSFGSRVYNEIGDFRSVTGAPIGSRIWSKEDSVDYRFYTNGSVDKMNSNVSDLQLMSQGENPFEGIKKGSEQDDIIKFGFECMSNDVPGQSVQLMFRAFLTKGISDNHSAELSSFKYMGRGETFHTYQGFNRSIGFGFKIVAFSKKEMIPLYNKLNYLVSQVYPDYSPLNSVMRAPIVKLTIGDYIYRMPGFIGSINLTVDEGTTWETNVNNSEDTYQLPKIINVDVDFKPIFDELPQRSNIGEDKIITGMPIIGWRGNKNNSLINVSERVRPAVQPSTDTKASNDKGSADSKVDNPSKTGDQIKLEKNNTGLQEAIATSTRKKHLKPGEIVRREVPELKVNIPQTISADKLPNITGQ